MPPTFQAGAKLREGAIYVERQADTELFEALKEGLFCYVLAPRQIGKSSLCVRTARRLREQGRKCLIIDLTTMGSDEVTQEQWYAGLVQELHTGLKLTSDPAAFWRGHQALAPVHRWSRYLRDEVLTQVSEPVVVFIDEIDTVLALPFPMDDFFAAVRAVYNARAESPACERLTFCLLGVAAPEDLMRNAARTPFNIGRAISLGDFTREEARQLLAGLHGLAGTHSPEALLDAALSWTSGHPYMTQRICAALQQQGEHKGSEQERVAALVGELFLRRGRVQESNLAYAEKSISKDNFGVSTGQMLRLYRRLLLGQRVSADNEDRVQMALRLTGMAAEHTEEGGVFVTLRVRNRIFAQVFDMAWVRDKTQSRWTAALWAAMIVLVLVSAGGGLWQAYKKEQAEDQAARSEKEARLRAAQVVRAESGLSAALAVAYSTRKGQEGEALLAGLLAVGPSLREHHALPPMALEGLGEAIVALRRSLPLYGHTGPVAAVAFSPDGARVVTASEDGTARLWDARTGKGLAVLTGHRDHVGAAAFSPDGTQVVTASEDGTARLWDARTGKGLAVLAGHQGNLRAVAFSPDGRQVVTAGADRAARLWDAATFVQRFTLSGHESGLSTAAFSPDGAWVVTASADHTARLWDAGSGKARCTLKGHTEKVTFAGFSPDSRLVVTTSADHTARLWDAGTCRQRALLKGHAAPVDAAAFTPDSRRVVTASAGEGLRVWDTRGGEDLWRMPDPSGSELKDAIQIGGSLVSSPREDLFLNAGQGDVAFEWDAGTRALVWRAIGHSAMVLSAVFSLDGQRIATASRDRTARIWSRSAGQELLTLEGHADGVRAASFSPSGKRVLTAGADHTARMWDAASGKVLFSLGGHADTIKAALFSPDGKRVVTAGLDGIARVWDASGGQALFTLRGHEGGILAAAFSADGRHVVTAGADHTARVFSAESGKEVARLQGHTDKVLSAAFSPDGKRVVTAGADRTARVWSAGGGEPLLVLSGHRDIVRFATFSPDGRWVATAGADGTVRVWDAGSGRQRSVGTGPGGVVWSARFSPDGARLVSAGADHTARVWDAASGKERFSLGHADSVSGAWFSPDGRQIVTASMDHTAGLWDGDTGQLLLSFKGHTAGVGSAVFSPDGGRVVTASLDGTAKIYPATAQGLLALGCQLLSYQPESSRVGQACDPGP